MNVPVREVAWSYLHFERVTLADVKINCGWGWQGFKQEDHLWALAIIHVRGGGEMDEGSSKEGGEKWSF